MTKFYATYREETNCLAVCVGVGAAGFRNRRLGNPLIQVSVQKYCGGYLSPEQILKSLVHIVIIMQIANYIFLNIIFTFICKLMST